MDRLFLDANILFSAAWRPDSRLRRLWTLPDTVIITSDYAVGETVRHLKRGEQLERLRYLLTGMEIVRAWSQISLPEGVQLPEKDRPILQGAIAAQSTHLITGDRQDFGLYFGQVVAGIEILLPAAYLRSK